MIKSTSALPFSMLKANLLKGKGTKGEFTSATENMDIPNSYSSYSSYPPSYSALFLGYDKV